MDASGWFMWVGFLLTVLQLIKTVCSMIIACTAPFMELWQTRNHRYTYEAKRVQAAAATAPAAALGGPIFAYEMEAKARMDKVWEKMIFCHPATLETVALPSTLKADLGADLDAFISTAGETFYRTRALPYRRCYELCGRDGSGRSTLIAAIANRFNLNIFTVDLTIFNRVSELVTVLRAVNPASVLVINGGDSLEERLPLYSTLTDNLVQAVYSFLTSSKLGSYDKQIVLIPTNFGGDSKIKTMTKKLAKGRFLVSMGSTFPPERPCDTRTGRASASLRSLQRRSDSE